MENRGVFILLHFSLKASGFSTFRSASQCALTNLYFCCSEPRYALSLLPLPPFGFSRRGGVDAHTVLLSVLPLTLILASVWPMESSMAFFFVVYVVSLIHTSVGPAENALTLHFVVLPKTLVLASIRPIVHTLPNEKVPTR